MKLYRTRIKPIAHEVVAVLCHRGMIEVLPENIEEAEQDLVAIMEEYLRRESALRRAVKDHMSNNCLSSETYGRVRRQIAEEWNHPLGRFVEKYLSRQFVENFMLSNYIDEVFEEDEVMIKLVRKLIEGFDVNENVLLDEAREQIRNIQPGTIDYEISLSKALYEVKKRHGLIK